MALLSQKKRSRSDASGDGAPAAEEDVPFPRGGASLLTPLEERKIKVRAKADFEREIAGSRGPERKKKRKSADSEKDVEGGLFKIQSATGDVPKFVDLLKFTSLTVGGKIWGVVLEVTSKRLVVSLPLGLRGFVAPEDASDVLAALSAASPTAHESELRAAFKGPAPSLDSLFYPGQFVRCVVKSLDAPAEKTKDKKAGKKKVHLSLKVSDVSSGMDKASLHIGAVLPAVVRTVEEHGSVLSLGIDRVSAFLPTASYTAAFGAAAAPLPGQLLQVVVKKLLRAGSSAIVGCESAEVAQAAITGDNAVTMNDLLPGHLVTVTVRHVLPDGLVVSFLKYFHGCIDRFHLPQDLLSSWRTAITPGMRLKARILYIAHADKLVRLSLLKNLVSYHLPTELPTLGTVYDPVRVFRADPAVGVLCSLPPESAAPFGYVHISNLRDGTTVPSHVSKEFPPSTELRAKVIGFRPMDALVTLTARPAAVESSDVTWDTLEAGMVLAGRVHAVRESGLTVQLTPEIRGLVPLAHVSDSAAPRKVSSKFKPGQSVRVRAIEVDGKRKRVMLSMKKGVLSAKSPVLLSAAAAERGMRTHGWVTGVTPTAVFVGLYNKLKGIVPAKSIALPADTTLQEAYPVGQVVKCTVVGEDPAKGLRLSFSATVPASAAADAGASAVLGGLTEGQIVCNATVTEVEKLEDDDEHVTECTLALETPSGETVVAKMDRVHFSDHTYGCEVVSAALCVGAVIPRVLVLERRPKSGHVRVSRKAALLKAAEAGLLPASVSAVSAGQHIAGYVSSMTAKSCFVRFLGRCTARAGASQLGDEHVAAAHDAYREGQTVMAVVLEVETSKDQMTVSLKPSQTARSDSALLASLFEDMKLAATIAGVDTSAIPRIGSVITVPAKQMQPYGMVCDIPGDSNLAGLIATSNLPPGDLSPGDTTEAAVMDVHELDGIVDLSASEDIRKACQHSKGTKAMSAMTVGDKVSAKVVLVKPEAEYCVVQLDGHKGVLGFVPNCDYNVQHGNAKKSFEQGETFTATVVSCPSPGTGGRLLLHTPLLDTKKTSHKGGAAKGSKAPPGSVVNGTVAHVHSGYAEVTVDGVKGRLNASEVQEMDTHTSPAGTKPLAQLKAGQEVRVVVLPQTHHFLLSMRPSAIAAAEAASAGDFAKALETALSVGQEVAGAVDEAKTDHLYISLPNDVRVRVHCLHASEDPVALGCLPEKFSVGSVVRGRLLEVDTERKHVSMSLLPATFAPLCKGGPSPKEGQLVMAKVQSASGQGVWCWLANGAVATAALTELHDAFVANALEGLQAGTFVRAAVAQLPGKGGKLKLSLRSSQGASHAGHTAATDGPETPKAGVEQTLRKGQIVHGYVRSVKPAKSKGAGVFVSLSDSVAGRIQLRNLADTYIEDPSKEFAEGKHISARVLMARDGLVELTCKTAKPDTRKPDLADFSLGQELKGTVTRAEAFGIFVQLDESNVTGLVHVSELSGKFVKNVPAEYPVGRKVKAVVLSIDTEKGRLALGMKAKYFTDGAQDGKTEAGEAGKDTDPADTGRKMMNIDVENALLAAYDESDDEDSGVDKEDHTEADGIDEEMHDAIEASSQGEEEEEDSDEAPVNAAEAAGTSEADESDDEQTEQPDLKADPYGWDALLKPAPEPVKEVEVEETAKLSKRAKKKAREEQEAAVRKAELAKLQDAPPENTEDFERLVLGSPNSSYLWIRYMAFLLGMAEVTKARDVTERALKTIDLREQGEKFNVWVAYLNLENSFADDPTQAAADLFKRAVQQNDAKKMHLAAIDIFQRSQRKELLEMCAKSIRRKFRESCKVWLRLVQLALDDTNQTSTLLTQATQALPKRKHVKFLSRVALLEFKEGSPDRGRGVFENILQTYPKRTDVWGMYIDQEIKLGKTVPVRNLFERAINLNLKPKRMRYFFKRYLSFEEEHGTPDKVDYVKKCAMDFIQGQSGNDR